MRVFIDWLIRHGTPSLPAAMWRVEVGDETTAALEAARLVRRVALNADDTYPCPSPTWPGCPRRIIEDRDGCLRAVCGDEGHCDGVRIPEDLAYQIEVEPGALARGLSALMGLAPEGVGVPMGKVWPLGVRSIAARPLRVFYSPGCSLAELLHALEPAPGHHPEEVKLVVLPRLDALPATHLQELRLREHQVLALDSHLRLEEGRFQFGWAAFLIEQNWRHGLCGADLLPEMWLVLDPQRAKYWFGGEDLSISRGTQMETVLLMLAENIQAGVPRAKIAHRLWPGEFTSGPEVFEEDAAAIDGNARKALSALNRRLNEARRSAPPSLRSELLDVISSRDGIATLGIPPERVFWLSRADL